VLIVQSPPAHWKVKVCDLGLSKRVEQAAGDNASTSINYYSPGYCPPEKLLNYDNHEDIDGYKVDMWCFGELVLRALTGEPSFKNAKDLHTWCRTGEGYPDQRLRDLEVSEGVIDFLHSVMACEPATRPTAEAACGHRWWADLDPRSPSREPTPGPSRPENMSLRSAPDMRLPVEAPNIRQNGRRPQQSLGHDATPYPRWETPNSGWAIPGLIPSIGCDQTPIYPAQYKQAPI
jgi:serine/threonine protein kinase